MSKQSQRDQIEIEKLKAEVGKLLEETRKMKSERMWYPFVVVGGIFGVAIAVAKYLTN